MLIDKKGNRDQQMLFTTGWSFARV